LGNVIHNESSSTESGEKYANLNSHIILCITSTIRDRSYAYIDFSPLKKLLLYGSFDYSFDDYSALSVEDEKKLKKK
jgi:hypothetical protein